MRTISDYFIVGIFLKFQFVCQTHFAFVVISFNCSVAISSTLCIQYLCVQKAHQKSEKPLTSAKKIEQ